MAYFSTLASVPQERILAFRRDRNVSLQASRIICVSHVVATWVWVQPLGDVLGEAIDGGEKLRPDVKHSFRSPVFHSMDVVPVLHQKLQEAHKAALAELDVPKDEWYEAQIRQVLGIFVWASERSEAVVSILGRPYNADWKSQGLIPILA